MKLSVLTTVLSLSKFRFLFSGYYFCFLLWFSFKFHLLSCINLIHVWLFTSCNHFHILWLLFHKYSLNFIEYLNWSLSKCFWRFFFVVLMHSLWHHSLWRTLRHIIILILIWHLHIWLLHIRLLIVCLWYIWLLHIWHLHIWYLITIWGYIVFFRTRSHSNVL